MTESRLRLDSKKKFFPVRVVRPWNSLSREAEAAPSLELFKPRLVGIGEPGIVEGVPVHGRGLEQEAL